MHQPARRMEEFFRFVGRHKRQSLAMAATSEQYGIRFLGPGLTPRLAGSTEDFKIRLRDRMAFGPETRMGRI